ncbi:hypothetical protein C8R43DRAFT_243241 [Mycena crocata]|nr:hypothetical protein C8R43DRAFT_243241 [Mycena crocata]
MWRTTKKAAGSSAESHSLDELVLKGLSYTHRALILDLGALFLMVQWLTHTSAQIYPRSLWESSVKVTHKKVRKFRVGMALIFRNYVLAFLSSDLVFQPTWKTSRDQLPDSPADFYSKNWIFLDSLASWMRGRLGGLRNGLACEVIRNVSDVFLGIGVYTVIELFFLAGLSPFMTEAELFSNPSRTARFAGAYLQYLHHSRTGLPGLLWPAMKAGYLAPTTRQRLAYMDWLYVYAKDRTRLPVRMAELVDYYISCLDSLSSASEPWVRYETTTLYDVFEPTLISTALSLEHNLGHLIYGRDNWVGLGGHLSDGQDSLTNFFHEQGLLDEPTFMRPNHYSPLFLQASDVRSQSLPRRPIFTYRNDKQLWSITPFPENSNGHRFTEDTATPIRIEGIARKRMLFSYIVEKTRNVAIGPLEYCGNAHLVSKGSSTIAVPCYGSPSLPEHYALRDIKSRLLPIAGPGVRRQMSETGQKEYEKQAVHLSAGFARKRAQDENEPPVGENGPSKPKKRRMNADQRLAAMSHV